MRRSHRPHVKPLSIGSSSAVKAAPVVGGVTGAKILYDITDGWLLWRFDLRNVDGVVRMVVRREGDVELRKAIFEALVFLLGF